MDEKTTGYSKDLYTDEAKRKRFIRVAERRINRLLNDLRLLGNTSNRGLYKYEQSDIDKIFGELDKKVAEVRSKFATGKHSKPFKLE